MTRVRMLLWCIHAPVLFGMNLLAGPISFTGQFNNAHYSQTSAAQPAMNSAVYFFDGQLFMQNAGDFSAGNVTLPGGVQPSNGTNNGANPDMALLSPTVFQYASPLLSQAAYNAEFPTGTYTYTGTNTPDQTVSVNQPAPDYTTTVPYITDFTGLQGMDASMAFNLTWNSFTNALAGSCAGTGTTCSFVFLDIFKTSGGANVFSFDFQPSSTTSVIIPANTLAPNTAYTFRLNFDNRQIISYSSGSALFAPEVASDVRTVGAFTTAAAPAPSTIDLSLMGIGALLVLRRQITRGVKFASSAKP